MSGDAGAAPGPGRSEEPSDGSAFEQDLALARLEEVLTTLSYDRALPDLHDLLDRAGVPEELLRRDERVLKVLHEAVLARPFGHIDEVAGVRTELELLTLEVELLTDRLADPEADPRTVDEATTRLAEARIWLGRVRDRL